MAHGNMTANGHNSEANGSGAGVVKGNYIDVLLSGVWTATLQVQMKDVQNNWVPFGADITTNGARFFECAQPDRPWRLAVTAFTSGTIVYEISGQRHRSRQTSF